MQKPPRRKFLAHCGSLLGMLPMLHSNWTYANQVFEPHTPSQLVDQNFKPIRLENLEPEKEYVFHYPFVSTPCFLIDLNRPVESTKPLRTKDGERYQAPVGIGPNRSVVAFSAICAHRMSHPTRAVSFIGYREKPTGFYTHDQDFIRRKGVIQCCSEQSVYDPADGGRVLGGPAPQPLAAIGLEIDNENRITANGVFGGSMFEQYFQIFGKRLLIEYERMDIDSPVPDQTEVIAMQDYSDRKIECG